MFEDALKDIDDALNLVYLFAALPAHKRLTPERTKVLWALLCFESFFVSSWVLLIKSLSERSGEGLEGERKTL